ncbi:protein serine/threonine kinase, putative [Entamoeba invadens IP1]|uniref:Protein serine/threonine kinase, putative n=1 Tax=Entamoeba invadens IP1 TaxID=370355 RepID=L7FMH6_ENTIV|nr:protein serine/threonine kinase, putative [Entamoeba invadens IP1]ELP89112.1 protein serine/threonine kinase, putative [Entamoeba invadens IP1]|eukprot:XP_004255883.1 protein serine/threonine kinase, putative [Entamoeba invadens IP1]
MANTHFLSLEEQRVLAQFTNKVVGPVVFNSDTEMWGLNDSIISDKIYQNSNLCFVIEDTASNKFGGVFFDTITDRSGWISSPSAFIFSLVKDGVSNSKKFRVRDSKGFMYDEWEKPEEAAFKMFELNNKYLFAFGGGYDIAVAKKGAAQSYCKTSKLKECWHRDIKPDNILVFSLDVNDKVNAKLTDFGSSRNINMMMTNMTFTKGIGTPKYTAPEILKKEKYKKSADIFSLGVTMFECFSWKEAYPKEDFKYPWKIAEFVMSGKRLENSHHIPNNVFAIIASCWCLNSNERISSEEVVLKLEKVV